MRERDGLRLETAAGRMLSRNVIIATDGYIDGLIPELGRKIIAVGSGMIATGEIEANLLARLLPNNRVYGNTNRVFSYFRTAPGEQRLIWGGRVGRLASATSPRAFSHLARDMLRLFPDLKNATVTHGWAGLIGFSYDEVPHIGCTRDGVHFAIGYSGTGVSRATYFGHKLALKVLGDPEGRTAFDDLAFPSYPAYAVARRVAPVVETWYRVRDRYNF